MTRKRTPTTETIPEVIYQVFCDCGPSEATRRLHLAGASVSLDRARELLRDHAGWHGKWYTFGRPRLFAYRKDAELPAQKVD